MHNDLCEGLIYRFSSVKKQLKSTERPIMTEQAMCMCVFVFARTEQSYEIHRPHVSHSRQRRTSLQRDNNFNN